MLYVNPLEARSDLRVSGEGREGLREKAALKEFEQIFLYQLLREMRRTVPTDGVLAASRQQEFFEEMMDDFLAGKMAESGQLGIARQMELQLQSTGNGSKAASAAKSAEGIPLKSAAAPMPLDNRAPGIPFHPGVEGMVFQGYAHVGIPLHRGLSQSVNAGGAEPLSSLNSR
jgi:flagellar protein FlgJ